MICKGGCRGVVYYEMASQTEHKSSNICRKKSLLKLLIKKHTSKKTLVIWHFMGLLWTTICAKFREDILLNKQVFHNDIIMKDQLV